LRFHLDLSSKLALVLLLWTCAFILPWTVQAVLCLLIIASRHAMPQFRPVSERAAAAFSKFIVYSIVVATLVVTLNALLVRGGALLASVAGFSFYEEGLYFGAKTASRLLLLSFSVLIFFSSTPMTVFIEYLQSKGLPPSLVLVLLLTLHFLDHLPSRIHQIFLAQQARGAPVNAGVMSRTKALLTILSPLVLSSIVESIERGTALELRGFLNHTSTTQQSASRQTGINIPAVLFIALTVILIIYAISQWLNA
jgi:energy-coupling factor transport system permease protein